MTKDFITVVNALAGLPDVETARMFGSDGLKIRGKLFAMVVKGVLVVKLSRNRAEELVASGHAGVFDPGHGRAMKQWISVSPDAGVDWLELSREAMTFVGR
jgi:TfoX/Sxy family transcriptional regulator of competence genes